MVTRFSDAPFGRPDKIMPPLIRLALTVTIFTVVLFTPAGLAQPVANSSTNQLTAEEKAAGWILLFDGKTWDNWTLSKVRKSSWWKIEGGWIRSIPRGGNSSAGRRLATLESFRHFELQFDWKIAKAGNSGVKYRIQRVWRFKPQDLGTGDAELLPPTLESLQFGTALGFEYQLTDDENAPDALDTPFRSSAALYRIVAPRKNYPVIAGTVHSSRIRMSGDRFEHWLDGERVATGDLRSDGVRALLEANRTAGRAKSETAKDEQQKFDSIFHGTASAIEILVQ